MADELALSSTVENGLVPDGVRALKPGDVCEVLILGQWEPAVFERADDRWGISVRVTSGKRTGLWTCGTLKDIRFPQRAETPVRRETEERPVA